MPGQEEVKHLEECSVSKSDSNSRSFSNSNLINSSQLAATMLREMWLIALFDCNMCEIARTDVACRGVRRSVRLFILSSCLNE